MNIHYVILFLVSNIVLLSITVFCFIFTILLIRSVYYISNLNDETICDNISERQLTLCIGIVVLIYLTLVLLLPIKIAYIAVTLIFILSKLCSYFIVCKDTKIDNYVKLWVNVVNLCSFITSSGILLAHMNCS